MELRPSPLTGVVCNAIAIDRARLRVIVVHDANRMVRPEAGAQFVEVKVDPELGTVRVTRAIEVSASGKIRRRSQHF